MSHNINERSFKIDQTISSYLYIKLSGTLIIFDIEYK